MKMLVTLSITTILFAAATLSADDPPQKAPTPKETEWLKRFVGEWESESEGTAGPGQPPMKCKGTMSARMLGEFWVISEMKMNMMGTDMQAVQTLGYDEKAKKYVGTWVDSMMNHMWKYTGMVDAATKTLTFEAEGPNFLDPAKTSKYRDAYTFESKDHIVLKSSLLTDDGKWVTFMSGQIRRKK